MAISYRLVKIFVDWLTGWLVGQFVRLVGWLVRSFVGGLVDSLVGFVRRLLGGRLADQLLG